MSFSPFFYQAVQINSMQMHPNLSESKCFLCQDSIKCCNAFGLLFLWRMPHWEEVLEDHLWSTLPHRVVCTKYYQHPQPLLGPWEVGRPTQHLTWLTNPLGFTLSSSTRREIKHSEETTKGKQRTARWQMPGYWLSINASYVNITH